MPESADQPLPAGHVSTWVILLSVPGVVAELAYRLVDRGVVFDEFRSPMKSFVDTHFLLWLGWVYPSVLVFGDSLLYKLIRWSRAGRVPDSSLRRGIRCAIRVAATLTLAGIGFLVGHSMPLILAIILSGPGSPRFMVWSAVIGFAFAALAAEGSCSPGQKAWCRPLLWGAVLGSVTLLIRLIWIDWKIDLTVKV
ncbi:MAG: hypothetical protein R3C19_03730 [Planctomycetaceae bacterium]